MDTQTLVTLAGLVAIVFLFAGYGLFEWGRVVLTKAKDTWTVAQCQSRFAIPATIGALLPCFAPALGQKIGVLEFGNDSLHMVVTLATIMALSFVFLAVAFVVFSLKLKKAKAG
jgi:hypothetical protein